MGALIIIIGMAAWTIFVYRVGYNTVMCPRWSDKKLNNKRFVILAQGKRNFGGKYYAVLSVLDYSLHPCCYVMDKPLPDTPMFDRGNSADDIRSVDLGGDPIFKPWKPD